MTVILTINLLSINKLCIQQTVFVKEFLISVIRNYKCSSCFKEASTLSCHHINNLSKYCIFRGLRKHNAKYRFWRDLNNAPVLLVEAVHLLIEFYVHSRTGTDIKGRLLKMLQYIRMWTRYWLLVHTMGKISDIVQKRDGLEKLPNRQNVFIYQKVSGKIDNVILFLKFFLSLWLSFNWINTE